MILVKKLKPEQFQRLEKIFREEANSDVPDPSNSDIFGAFEDGKLIGFVLAEQIRIIGQIYVVPEKRNNNVKIVADMIKSLRQRYEGKECVGAIASESRFAKLYRSLGMQYIEGAFYRKNI